MYSGTRLTVIFYEVSFVCHISEVIGLEDKKFYRNVCQWLLDTQIKIQVISQH